MYRHLLSVLIAAALVGSTASSVAGQAADVVLDFHDTPVAEVVETLARATGDRILVDASATGRVSIVLDDRVTATEAREILHAALLLTGNALLPGPGGIWKVLPLQTALGQAPWQPEATGRASDRLVTTLVRLESARVESLVSALGLTGDGSGLVIPYPPTNSLILAMTEARLQTTLELVRALDRAADLQVRVLPVRYAIASELEGQIREALSRPGDNRPSYRLRADERTNSLIVEALPPVLEEIARLAATLDVPAVGRGVLHVVRILNADAEALAGQLSALEGDGSIESGYQVFADPPTNSLVIQGSPEAFASLMSVITRLDRVPRQAEIDVMVLELDLSRGQQFGIDFLFPLLIPKQPGDAVAAGAVGNLTDLLFGPPASDGLVGRVTRKPFVLPIGGIGVVPEGAANFTASEGDVRVRSLMQPHLLAASGETHRIFSGEQVPIASSSAQGATGGGFTTSVNIERRDVGIDLRFTPTVHSDDLVELELELSIESVRAAARATVVGNETELSNFEFRGTVRLVDGEVLVVGAAPRQTLVEIDAGVPYLRSIPILGWLFRDTVLEDRRRQIVVAVQARAMPTPNELRAESIRRRLAFERHLARTGPLRSADSAPYALLVATRSTHTEAAQLLPELEPLDGEPLIHEWELHGEHRFDVYLTGFESLRTVGRVALELRAQAFHPALHYVGLLAP